MRGEMPSKLKIWTIKIMKWLLAHANANTFVVHVFSSFYNYYYLGEKADMETAIVELQDLPMWEVLVL